MLLAYVALAGGSIAPFDLRVENLIAPMGVDIARPRFSWKVREASPNLKNLRQTAYRLRVSSDSRSGGDLWTSAITKSGDTYGIPYDGKPLASNRRVWWQVQTWDQDGIPSAWSSPASFSTGLSERDWKGSWITYPEGFLKKSRGLFERAYWIWSSQDALKSAPVETKTFTYSLALSVRPRTAMMSLTADDQFILSVNGKEVLRSDQETDSWRRYHSLDIAKSLKPGLNEIKVVASNREVSPAGLIAALVLDSGVGPLRRIVTGEPGWIVDGHSAPPISSYGVGPWGKFEVTPPPSATNYLKEFSVTKPIRRATLFGTALGLVDFQVNGKAVCNDFFTPGWSDYDKRVYFQSYDVTRLLGKGENKLGAVVGDGWFSGYVGYGHQRAHYGPKPMLRAQLIVEFADGTSKTIATDRTWRVGQSGIRQNDFLMGETYDAGFAPGPFKKNAVEMPSENKRNLEWFPGNPVRRYARIKPKTIKKLGDRKYLLDYGQNLAGFVRIESADGANLQVGRPVVMRFGEVLQPDGNLYTDNLRGAKAIDVYIPAKGPVDWQPRFTFHGFRYCEVSGISQAPDPGEFTAVAISSATPETGILETSDPLLNKIVKNAWWTQKMNFIDIPTDCPQRDERLGWTGDAQAYIRTASTYSDVQAFFTKWLVALDDGQRADGQYPMVAPLKVAEADGGPAWADAGVICPWTIYDVYGDKRQLAQHYPNMKRFVDFTKSRSKPNLLPPDSYHCFGDWLQIGVTTPPDVIYEAYFAGSARLLARSARVLGKEDDAAKYELLYKDVRKSFNEAYATVDGVVAGDTQCGYVLALAFDLLDDAKAKMAGDRLVADIEKRGWHLNTGFVGTRDLMQVLSKIGRNDVAFRLLHNTTFPSWGFEVVNGATTIWERWDGWTPERGFQDPGMNSFAHYAYGAVVGWMFQEIGGIKNAEPGFARILIAPEIDRRLRYANASFESVRGTVNCDWRIRDSKLWMTVTIPANASAEVRVPNPDGSFISNSVGSGTYSFSSEKWEL
jgi:alpha-L-rhamnosidase